MTSAAEPIGLTERRAHGRGFWGDAVPRLRRSPGAMVGAVLAGLVVLLGLVGPLIAPYDYRVQDIEAVLANGGPLPPLSPGHILGTDQLGRDILSRVIDGASVSVSVAFAAQLVILVIGMPIGAIAAWAGGRTDALLMRLVDVVYAFPELLFIILVTSAFLGTPVGRIQSGLLLVMLAIALSAWVTMARLTRAQVLSLKHREFTEAARAIGLPARRIMVRHILPNAIGPIVVAVSVGIPAAILAESTLSFLGLGVQAPRASWGSLIAAGAGEMDRWPWLVIPALAAVVVAVVGFTLLGDAVRDALDPRSVERN